MSVSKRTSADGGVRRRADAERSVAAILDAAINVLTLDPEASMAQIAGRAGVARATVYVHFPTRDGLIAAITERAMAEANAALDAAALNQGPPVEALERMLSAGWHVLSRYHALVAINTQRGPDHIRALHQPIYRRLRPLLKRGRASGDFTSELPLDWMITVLLELIHTASRELTTGRLPKAKAERVLITTAAALLANPAPAHSLRRAGR